MPFHPCVAAAIVPLLMLLGCGGNAELMRADARGGAMTLSGSYSARAAQARLLMAEHCQGTYAITPTATGGDRRYPAPSQRVVTFECTSVAAIASEDWSTAPTEAEAGGAAEVAGAMYRPRPTLTDRP